MEVMVISMRTTLYNDIDEILDENISVLLSHNGDAPMDWTPTRQSALFALSGNYPTTILNLCNKVGYDVVHKIRLNPSQYMKSAYKFQIISKTMTYSIEDVSKCYFFLCNCAVLSRQIVIEDGITFYKENRVNFQKSNIYISKLISYINAGLRAYCEAIFCDDHTIGGEIVGPVLVDNKPMIIRDYHRLMTPYAPTEIAILPVKRVRTFCTYNCTDIFIDLNGNLQSTQNMVDGLLSYCVEVTDYDNRVQFISSEDELSMLLNQLDKALIAYMTYYKSLDDVKKTELLIDNEYFALQPLFDYAQVDWKTASSSNREYVVDNEYIKINKEKRKKLFEITDVAEREQYAREMLDPRIKWL